MIDEVLIGLDDIVNLSGYPNEVKQSMRNIFGAKRQAQKMFEEHIGTKDRLDNLLNHIMLDAIRIGAELQHDKDVRELIQANDAKERIEAELHNALKINGDVVRLCDKHGITRANLARALGTSLTKLYYLSKEGKENANSER